MNSTKTELQPLKDWVCRNHSTYRSVVANPLILPNAITTQCLNHLQYLCSLIEVKSERLKQDRKKNECSQVGPSEHDNTCRWGFKNDGILKLLYTYFMRPRLWRIRTVCVEGGHVLQHIYSS